MTGAGGHAGVPSQASRSKGSAVPCAPAPGAREPEAGVRSLFPDPSALWCASRAEHRGAAGKDLARPTARGGAARAPEPVSSPPCASANPAPSAGEERKAPGPAGTAMEGGARPRTSAPERSRHKSAPPAPAIQWPSSPSGAPLPCSPGPARVCTHIWAARDGGPPGSRSSAPGSESVPRASSQPRLGGPLSLAKNSDLRRVACRPPKTKGKRGKCARARPGRPS